MSDIEILKQATQTAIDYTWLFMIIATIIILPFTYVVAKRIMKIFFKDFKLGD